MHILCKFYGFYWSLWELWVTYGMVMGILCNIMGFLWVYGILWINNRRHVKSFFCNRNIPVRNHRKIQNQVLLQKIII